MMYHDDISGKNVVTQQYQTGTPTLKAQRNTLFAPGTERTTGEPSVSVKPNTRGLKP